MESFYLGRQPILDDSYRTTAYHLMFHPQNAGGDEEEVRGARLLVHGLMDIGLEALSNNLPVFVPASRELLLRGAISEFPAAMLGVLIDAAMPADDDVLAVCSSLRQQGYQVMLDGLEEDADFAAMLEVANLLRIDIGEGGLVGRLPSVRAAVERVIAANVHTLDELEHAKALGCHGFQGYFFCRPQIVEGKTLPTSGMMLMKALRTVITAEAVSEVEDVIARDVTLSYRLLKHINSAAFGLRRQVESVRQALGLLGLSNIRQWLSVLLLADAGKGKPRELVRIAMQRGKILEGIAEQRAAERKEDYFLLGLFSVLDALLGISMERALEGVGLPDDIYQGLIGEGECARLLQMLHGMEHGDWQAVDALARGFGLNCGDLMGIQTRAMCWLGENTDLLGASA